MKNKLINFFDCIIYWCLILFPFSMSIAPVPTYIFMGWLFFSFIAKKILKKEAISLKNISIILPFLALFIISALSMVKSIDMHGSMRGLLKLVQYFFVFTILTQEIRDKKHLMKILIAAGCGIFLSSVDGIWQLFSGFDFIRGREIIYHTGVYRITAAFPNANVFSIYLSALIPLLLPLGLYYLKGKEKALALIVLFTGGAAILLAISRFAILAVFIALLVLILIKKDKLLISLILIACFITPFVVPQSLKDWMKETSKYGKITILTNPDRIAIYRNAINMIKHNPVIGVGVSTFSNNYFTYKLPEKEYEKTDTAMYAHNNFLHMAGEIGLVGLACFLWLLTVLFVDIAKTRKFLDDDFLNIVHLGAMLGIIAFLINGLTETSLYYSRVSMIFWYLIGLTFAIKKLAKENNG